MTEYKATGKAKIGKQENPFEKTIEAENKKVAKETIYSTLGSEHSIPRTKITIEKIEQVE